MNTSRWAGGLTVGVLALQGDVREHEAALRGCGAVTRRVRTPADLDSVDALVLPGGESTTMSNLAVRSGLIGPLRARIAAGMPAFGSCAGMILLAERVLDTRPDHQGIGGLDVTVRRNAFGRQIDSFEADLLVRGIPGEVRAVFIRAPWVEQHGPKVEVLAQIPADPARLAPAVPTGQAQVNLGATPAAARIVAVRQGAVLATAFHPELTGDNRLHRLFLEFARESLQGIDRHDGYLPRVVPRTA